MILMSLFVVVDVLLMFCVVVGVDFYVDVDVSLFLCVWLLDDYVVVVVHVYVVQLF